MDTGKDKVKKICDVLKRETLDPAKKTAEEMIDQARLEAQSIVEAAQKEAAKVLSEAQKEIEKHRNVFQSSLHQACKQALEVLKHEIEEKLFNPSVSSLIHPSLQEPKVLADLIQSVVKALEKEGTDANLSAFIPKAVSVQDVNALLLQNILQKLKTNSVQLGSMQGGIAVRVENNQLTIDITENALKELVADYIRKDFREILFRAQ